jgi:hypothetical protein
MNTRIRVPRAAFVVAVLASACTSGDAHDAPADAPGSVAEASVDGSLGGPGPWTARSTTGAEVTLSVGASPIAAGPTELTLTVAGQANSPLVARSVDLVSSEMPLHGVARFPVTDGVARLQIPMEGRWALYVNLDEAGGDAAEFIFDVAPNRYGGHQHGDDAMPMDMDMEHEMDAPEKGATESHPNGGSTDGTGNGPALT